MNRLIIANSAVNKKMVDKINHHFCEDKNFVWSFPNWIKYLQKTTFLEKIISFLYPGKKHIIRRNKFIFYSIVDSIKDCCIDKITIVVDTDNCYLNNSIKTLLYKNMYGALDKYEIDTILFYEKEIEKKYIAFVDIQEFYTNISNINTILEIYYPLSSVNIYPIKWPELAALHSETNIVLYAGTFHLFYQKKSITNTFKKNKILFKSLDNI